MEILKFGNGLRVELCRSTLERSLSSEKSDFWRLIILPVPTAKDGVHITGTDTELFSILEYVEAGTFLAGYGIPAEFKAEIIARGASVYDGAEDEEFLIENARITAHGALGKILTETGRDVSELTIGIIGYGRIGSALAELLLFLSAGVKVYSVSRHKICMLAAEGVFVEEIGEDTDFADLDIIINTAPASLITAEQQKKLLNGKTKIIELASGDNFSDERVVKMGGIPDKMYPLSAGRLYAGSIIKAIKGATSKMPKQ